MRVQDEVYMCEVSIRDVASSRASHRASDVVYLTKPIPVWELDPESPDGLSPMEYVLNLNAHTLLQRTSAPSAWAHTRDALQEQVAGMCAEVEASRGAAGRRGRR